MKICPQTKKMSLSREVYSFNCPWQRTSFHRVSTFRILHAVRFVPLVLWHPSWPPYWWNMSSFRRHLRVVAKGRIFDDDDDDEMTRFAKSQTSAQFLIQQCIKTIKMTFCSSFQFQLSQTSKPSGRTWNFMVVRHLEFCEGKPNVANSLEDWRIQICQKEDLSKFCQCQWCQCSLQESRLFLGAVLLSMISCFGLFDVGRIRWKNLPEYLEVHAGANGCRNGTDNQKIVANNYYTFCHSICWGINSWVYVFGPYSPCFLRIVGCLRMISLSNFANSSIPFVQEARMSKKLMFDLWARSKNKVSWSWMKSRHYWHHWKCLDHQSLSVLRHFFVHLKSLVLLER